jgi:hypothetical protein
MNTTLVKDVKRLLATAKAREKAAADEVRHLEKVVELLSDKRRANRKGNRRRRRPARA